MPKKLSKDVKRYAPLKNEQLPIMIEATNEDSG